VLAAVPASHVRRQARRTVSVRQHDGATFRRCLFLARSVDQDGRESRPDRGTLAATDNAVVKNRAFVARVRRYLSGDRVTLNSPTHAVEVPVTGVGARPGARAGRMDHVVYPSSRRATMARPAHRRRSISCRSSCAMDRAFRSIAPEPPAALEVKAAVEAAGHQIFE